MSGLNWIAPDPGLVPPTLRRTTEGGGGVRWGACLAGGTLLGAVQPPIMHVLEQLLGPPALLAGTSIGANNAPMAAAGRHDDLRQLWSRVDGPEFFLSPNIDVWNGLKSVKRLRKLHDDWDTCTGMRCPTYVGLVDAATRGYRSICLNDLDDTADRRDAVVASSLQAFIMERWKFQGRYCLDGGFKHVCPLLPGWETLDFIVHVFCSPVGSGRVSELPQRKVAQAWEQGLVGIEMLLDVVVARDFQRAKAWSTSVPTMILAPVNWDQIGRSFDGDRETIRHRWNVVAPSILESPMFCGGPGNDTAV